jgi:hypothetical protein
MTGRLNQFQKTMLQWNELHPYNAVHFVRMTGPTDLARLCHAIDKTLERRGVARLTLSRDQGTFSYQGGPASLDISIISGGNDPQQALTSEIERQLNTPFVLVGPFLPFRFFVLPDTESFTVGLVYFHAIADAEAVVQLLKEIVATYEGLSGNPALGRSREASPQTSSPPLSTTNSQPIDPNLLTSTAPIYRAHTEAENAARAVSTPGLYPPRYDNLLRHYPGVLARRLAALPRFVRNMRCSNRPRFQDPNDFKIGFRFFSLSEGNLSTLQRASKSWDVTVHDLFLTLLLKGVASMAPERARARRRKEFSVGSIVNIRKDLGMDGTHAFGLFLGSFVVTHPVPAGICARELAGDIRRQTARIKSGRLYLGTPLELATVRLALSFFSTAGMRKFYQKHYPLWGGITNMNLNALWPQQDGELQFLDYARAVSTGPATPLVLSATTVGRRVCVGVSYRTTVFSDEMIVRFTACFFDGLREMEAPA